LDNLRFYRTALEPDEGLLLTQLDFAFAPAEILQAGIRTPVAGDPVTITLVPLNSLNDTLDVASLELTATARDRVTGEAVSLQWDLDQDGSWDAQGAQVSFSITGTAAIRVATYHSSNPVVITFTKHYECYGDVSQATPTLYWKPPLSTYIIYDQGASCGSALALGEAGRTRTLTVAAVTMDCTDPVASYVDTAYLSIEYVNPASPVHEATLQEGSSILLDWGDGTLDGLVNVDVTYPEAGIINFKVQSKDIPDISATKSCRYVPSELSVTAQGIHPYIAGHSFNLDIQARNVQGQPTQNYNQVVTITTQYVTPDASQINIAAQVLPTTARAFSSGFKRVNANYREAGIINIVVQDSLCAALGNSLARGTEANVEFIPDHLRLEVQEPCKPFFYTGEPFVFRISARGVSDVFADTFATRNYLGGITTTVGGGTNLTVDPSGTFRAEDNGVISLSGVGHGTDGLYTLSAQAANYGSRIGSLTDQVQIYHAQVVRDSTADDGDDLYIPDVVYLSVRTTAAGILLTQDNCSHLLITTVDDDNNSVYLDAQPFLLRAGRTALPLNRTQTIIYEGNGTVAPEHETVWITIRDTNGYLQSLRLPITLNPPPPGVTDPLQSVPLLDWKSR